MKNIIILIIFIFTVSLAYSQDTTVTVEIGEYAVRNFTSSTHIKSKATSAYTSSYNPLGVSISIVDTVISGNETRPVGLNAYKKLQRDSVYSYLELDDDTTITGADGFGIDPIVEALFVDTIAHPNAINNLVSVTIESYIYQTSSDSVGNYYVSNTGSDDSTGTSPETAWETILKVRSFSFAPGDTVQFNASDTFEAPLVLTSSGTIDSSIVLSRYGTGADPIIDGSHPSAVWSAVGGHAGVYSTPIYGGTIQGVWEEVSGEMYDQSARGVETLDDWLDSLAVGEWGFDFSPQFVYLHTLDDNAPPQMLLMEWAAVYSVADYITFDNLDVRKSHMGIVANGTQGVIASNNNIQDMFWNGMFFGNCIDAEIHDNVVARTGETSIYLSWGGDNHVHHNTVSYTQGVILGIDTPVKDSERSAFGLQQGEDNIVEYNDMSYIEGSFIDYWVEVGSIVRYNEGFHAGSGAFPHGTGLELSYNVFDLDSVGTGIGGFHITDENSPAPNAGINKVYNNTVLNYRKYGIFSGAGKDSTHFKNNLIVPDSTVNLVDISVGVEIVSNNNGYYRSDGGVPRGWYWNDTKYATLTLFQAASSQDANSFYGDPLFTDAAGKDFTLQTGSPAINTGVDVGLTHDILGNPIVGVPDMGAYEKQ